MSEVVSEQKAEVVSEQKATLVPEGWEPVIGLEVHCELKTATKLFCGCRNAFGDEPNTNVCPVCLGLPGSLPVLNERAVELAMAIGTALNCEIRPSTFHRKNYFYPDMPKDYQISQYDQPINSEGRLDLPDGSSVRIERAHMEEDTGKTSHRGGGGRIHDAEDAAVDYNRAGVPLVEIVSGPDITSSAQARLYASELRGVVVACGASDGRMEEGSMRVDANVSVRRVGDTTLGTRCEIKNLNSLRSLSRAIDHEIIRQVDLIESGDRVVQQTRHWDEVQGRTVALRSKEEAYDYRYFPEPDLVALVPDQQWQNRIAEGLAPMPAQLRRELVDLMGDVVSAGAADQIATVVELGLDRLVLAAIEGGIPPQIALARTANEAAVDVEQAKSLAVSAYIDLLGLERDSKLSATQSKAVLSEMLSGASGTPAEIAGRLGFEAMAEGDLAATVAEVVAASPDEWGRYSQGEDKLAQYFIGQVMKASKGKANGKAVIGELQRLRNGG